MRLRLGFLLGFALGYVLGSRAGRERYDQIVAAVRKVKPADPFDVGGPAYDAAPASVTGTGSYSSSR